MKLEKKLALNKETLRQLNGQQAAEVVGGASDWTCATANYYCVKTTIVTEYNTGCACAH